MKSSLIRGRRALVALGLTAALAVPVAVFAGGGAAQSTTAAQAQYAPQNTGSPQVSGTAQEGQTLTASTGSWSSSSDISYSYQWQRCNSSGSACTDIAGAKNNSYTVQSADVGNRLRVVVTAHNKDGSAAANSPVTSVVTAKTAQGTGNTGSSGSSTTVAAADINLPDRLVIDKVQFSPSPVRTLGTITARFHISETQHGKSVTGALVYALGLPYSRVSTPGEVQTDANGWATITFAPGRFFPRKGYVTFFVRARKAGGDLLAGVSTRRLVQVVINR
jgi:hypothetical protein